MTQRLAVLVAGLLLAAACGSSPDLAVPVDESTSPVDDSTSVADESEAFTDDSPTDVETAAPPCSGDGDPSVAAATADETFDASYLNTSAGNFPSLDDPVLIAGSEATWIEDDDIVMGVIAESGETQAYPVNQMAYHHVANTSLAGEPFVVTY